MRATDRVQRPRSHTFLSTKNPLQTSVMTAGDELEVSLGPGRVGQKPATEGFSLQWIICRNLVVARTISSTRSSLSRLARFVFSDLRDRLVRCSRPLVAADGAVANPSSSTATYILVGFAGGSCATIDLPHGP